MKDKKKLIVLIVMLLMPVAGIWYFIKMSLKYMKGAEIEIFFIYEILYLIFDYPHKHYTFKYFEV